MDYLELYRINICFENGTEIVATYETNQPAKEILDEIRGRDFITDDNFLVQWDKVNYISIA